MEPDTNNRDNKPATEDISSQLDKLSTTELNDRLYGLLTKHDKLIRARAKEGGSPELQAEIDNTTVDLIYTQAAAYRAEGIDKPAAQ